MIIPTRPNPRRSGFTLAEAAVTIAIVALVLTITMQALEGAKITAIHTMYRKTAKELGVELLGAIEAGRWQDEIESGMGGTFAEQSYPDFTWELVLGDETFTDRQDERYEDERYRPFDTWKARDDWRASNEEDDEAEEEAQPYEKVRLRIRYPRVRDLSDEMLLERWVRWAQIYGEEEEEEVPVSEDPNAGAGAGAGAGSGQTGGTGNGSDTGGQK